MIDLNKLSTKELRQLEKEIEEHKKTRKDLEGWNPGWNETCWVHKSENPDYVSYSKDFYERNEWMFTNPKYTQENLTGMFWQDINEGWDFMQPDMIAFLDLESKWELENPPPE